MSEQVNLTDHTPVFTRHNRSRRGRKKLGQHNKNMRYNQNHLRKLNNDTNNRNAAAMNRQSETIIRDNMISSVPVLRHMDGSMLNVQHVSNLPSALTDKYCVPSPTDVIAQSSHQRLYVLTSQKVAELKRREERVGESGRYDEGNLLSCAHAIIRTDSTH